MVLIFAGYIAICGISGCSTKAENDKIVKEKWTKNTTEWGGDRNMKRLEPVIIESRYEIYEIGEIKKKNCFGTMTENGDFAIGKIGKDGVVSVEPIVEGYPPKDSYGGGFTTDPFGSMMWVIDGREIIVIDADTKKTGKALTSPDGNERIHSIYVVDREKKLLFIDIIIAKGMSSGDINNEYYLIYDLNENKIVHKSFIKGTAYPLSPGKLLFWHDVPYMKGGKKFYKEWYSITDLFEKDDVKNELTKKLTKSKIQLDLFSNPVRAQAGKLFGIVEKVDKENYTFSIDQLVTWKENYKDVKINPIVVQIPKKGDFTDSFKLSGDGKWALGRFKYDANIIDVPELIIYHLSDIYPQGVSMPIYCGYSTEGTRGAFVDHEEWGPCYVELCDDFPNKLFVYKLNDGLKVMAENAREAAADGTASH